MKILSKALIAFYLLLLGLHAEAQTTGYSGTGANIDVTYHRINWRINPDSSVKAIGGSVTTYFKVVDPSGASSISFDLRGATTKTAAQPYFNNSSLQVKYGGAFLPATSVTFPVANKLTIALGTTLPLGKLDSVTIFYGGSPPAAAGSAEGYQAATYTPTTPVASAENYIYTLSESYEDRDWWPCKADMQDKIDSIDIIVSTPWVGKDTFWVATNGKLIDATINGNSRIFTFKNRYPMASYLVCVSVARYNRYYTTVNIGGTDVPVEYNLFRGKDAATYTNILAAMNKVNEAVTAFSAKFGDYPYKNEKHGFYEGLGGAGGMEHQTFSAIASNDLADISTLTHELMHQWFGDKVTFATWNDLWLAEGFARYSEALVGELVSGTGINPITTRKSFKTSTLNSYSTTSLVIPNASIANSDGIWGGSYGGAVYAKGAMVVSMLRKLAGDTKFFAALKNYMNDPALAYKSATTNDLKNHFEAVLNYDLDPFFADYASTTGKGNPAYDVNWGSTGNRINIELSTQRKSTSSTVAYFRTPVVLRIYNSGKTKDTTVVIYDENGKLSYAGNGIQATRSGKVLSYILSFTPASVEVDPDSETLVRASNSTLDASASRSTVAGNVARLATSSVILLDINILDFSGIAKQRSNLLSLELTSTSDNIKVILERSETGMQFYSLGEMNKISTTSAGLNYQFSDNNISIAPVYYYRAKTIDELGVIKYSKVVRIANAKENEGVLLNPNPASDYFQVSLPASWQNEVMGYTIYSSGGAVVKNERISNAGNSVGVSVRQLPAGSYTIELSGKSGKQLVKSFIVSR